jgi:hypothetical protein
MVEIGIPAEITATSIEINEWLFDLKGADGYLCEYSENRNL